MGWQPLKNFGQACKFWLIRRLPTCEDLLPVISRQLDRKLKVREWIPLKLHLFVCKWCLDYARQLSFLREAVREQASRGQDADEPTLSAAAKEKMKRSLSEL